MWLNSGAVDIDAVDSVCKTMFQRFEIDAWFRFDEDIKGLVFLQTSVT